MKPKARTRMMRRSFFLFTAVTMVLSLLTLPVFADEPIQILARILPGGPPVGMVVTPDGASLLVRSAGSVLLLDTTTGRLVQNLAVKGDGSGVCTDEEGDDVYTAGGGAENPPILWLSLEDRVLALKRAWTVPLGNDPGHRIITGLAYRLDKTVYATDTADGTLFKVAGRPRAVTGMAQIGGHPGACALSTDGRTLAVADTGAVRFFDAETLKEKSPLSISRPVALAWAKDGRLFVADATGNVVRLIAGGKVRGTVAATGAFVPSALTLSPDGKRLYIGAALPSGGGTLLAVDMR